MSNKTDSFLANMRPLIPELRRRYRERPIATEIIRQLATTFPDSDRNEMQLAFMEIFCLTFSSSIAAGYWWIDGVTDIPEDRVNAMLAAAIESTRTSWDGSPQG